MLITLASEYTVNTAGRLNAAKPEEKRQHRENNNGANFCCSLYSVSNGNDIRMVPRQHTARRPNQILFY